MLKPLSVFTNPLTYIGGPATVGAAAAGAGMGVLSTAFNRGGMKKKPEQVKMDGGTEFYIANARAPYSFSIDKIHYVGAQRTAAIEMLNRNGLNMEKPMLISSISSMERDRYTYVSAINFTEANTNYDLPIDVVDTYDEMFVRGVRI